MTLRRDKLKQLYSELSSTCKGHLETDLFPDIDDLDLIDLVNYVNYELQHHYDNYHDYLIQKMQTLGISHCPIKFRDIIYPKIKILLNDIVDICRT